jgi:hypothetical protein
MGKQPLKKKTFTRPDISSIKEKLRMTVKTDEDMVKSSAEKKIEWILLPEAFEKAVKLPGIPEGYLSIITGWSNTGKSTIKNCIIAACHKQGILPVIFETENNFDFKYAIDCGMKAEPIMGKISEEEVNPDTGEVTITKKDGIVDYGGDFLYYDSKILAEQYGNFDYSAGKEVSKKRKTAVLEDVAHAMKDILDLQDDGSIQQPICFIWDSIGSIESFKSYASKTGNNMFDAAALSAAFSVLINNRIPTSRKISEKYTNTFVAVNKIWNDSMNSMGNIPSIELKGGKTFYYGARLIVHLGGMAKSSIKKLTATAKGETYNYGIITKIKVVKNQLPTPYNVTYEGTMACVHCGILPEDQLDEYKKENSKLILQNIESLCEKENKVTTDIDENDIEYSEEEGNDNE